MFADENEQPLHTGFIILCVPQPPLPRHLRHEERERRIQQQAAQLLGDDHRLLPRFLDVELQKREDAARIARILIEGGEIPPEANGKVLRSSADGHRKDRMRGTPIIAKGVSGTMRGTNPLAALIAKEEGRRRR
jgi:hypothetical protein